MVAHTTPLCLQFDSVLPAMGEGAVVKALGFHCGCNQ